MFICSERRESTASAHLKGPATSKYSGDKKEFVEHIRKVIVFTLIHYIFSFLTAHYCCILSYIVLIFFFKKIHN